MRAGVYRRISLDQTGDGAGVERQGEDCEVLVAQRGWHVVATFEDNSISAAGHRTRPGFEALLAAIETGQVDVVVAWAWDRLSRNRRDEVRLIEACKAHNVSVALVRGAGDLDMTSAVGRAIAEILASIGRMENGQKSERHRRALKQRAARGLPWGPIPAFGYAADRVTVVASEAELIKDAYVAVLAGASCRSIATQWNAAGVRTRVHPPKAGRVSLRKGGLWSGSAVRRVLINPRYMGVRATSVGTGGRRELVEVGAAAWQGVVEEDIWRATHSVLTDPNRHSTHQRARVHLLSGIAVCGRCASPMRSHVTQRGQSSYTCSAARHLSRQAGAVDDLVTAVLLLRLGRPDAAGLLVDSSRPDVAPLREEALALRSRLDSLAVDFADGDLTASQVRTATARIRARLADVEAQMSAAARAPVLAALVGVEDVAARWAEMDLDRRRAVIRAVLVPVILPTRRGPVFDPDSVRIWWRGQGSA